MVSNNILTIILILLIVGIIAYFYYNYKNFGNITDTTIVAPKDSNENKIKKRRVRFNDNVKYNTYNKQYSDNEDSDDTLFINSPKIDRNRSKNSSIDIDNMLALVSSSTSNSSTSSSARSSSARATNKKNLSPNIQTKLDSNRCSSDTEDYESTNKIYPSNLDQTDPEALWDASFGLPLMDKNEKKKFINKMQKNHKEYGKSLGQFVKYQMDDSTLIKTDITIDPFKCETQKPLMGNTIKEIYDRQVEGPKAKPKRIKTKTAACTIYEDESELNGGIIKGSDLYGFDGINNGYKTAAFGNEF